MASIIRVTGAWTQLLADWLDSEHLPAPDIRGALARWAADDIVPIPVWRELLMRATALRPQLRAPGLAIGAMVQPRHVGVMGYVVLASTNLGEAMLAYQRYERLFYGADLAEVSMDGRDVEIRWKRSSADMGQLVDLILKQSAVPIHFDRIYETDMAEGLKVMAIEGHGIAFLPFSAVKKDVRAKKLVSAAPPDMKNLQITMDVRAYRERPSGKEPGKAGMHASRSSAQVPKRNTQALWDYLLAQASPN